MDEEASIYDNDIEDYDQNVFEENTIAITSDKIVMSTRKWQQEQESNPHFVAANHTAPTFPVKERGSC